MPRRGAPTGYERGTRSSTTAIACALESTAAKASRWDPHQARLVSSIQADDRSGSLRQGAVGQSRWRVCALNADGVPVFSQLQAAMDEGRTDELVFFTVDLVFLNGESAAPPPLIQRGGRLQRLFEQQ